MEADVEATGAGKQAAKTDQPMGTRDEPPAGSGPLRSFLQHLTFDIQRVTLV